MNQLQSMRIVRALGASSLTVDVARTGSEGLVKAMSGAYDDFRGRMGRRLRPGHQPDRRSRQPPAQKLEAAGEPPLIRTIRGCGYVLGQARRHVLPHWLRLPVEPRLRLLARR